MDLLPHNSLNLVKKFRRDIDRLFGGWETFPLYHKSLFPKVDIEEKPDKFIFRAETPGIETKNIKILLKKDNALAIQGNTEDEACDEKEGFLKTERFSGSFYREFPLPSNIQPEEIRAHAKRGILEIVIPKKEIDQKFERIIEIEAAE